MLMECRHTSAVILANAPTLVTVAAGDLPNAATCRPIGSCTNG